MARATGTERATVKDKNETPRTWRSSGRRWLDDFDDEVTAVESLAVRSSTGDDENGKGVAPKENQGEHHIDDDMGNTMEQRGWPECK